MNDNTLNNNNLNLSKDNNEKSNEIIDNNFDENNLLIQLVKLDSDVFNGRTKCTSINYYESIIKLINKMNEDGLKQLLNYLNKVDIILLKILVNGFIEFDFNDENKNDLILKIILRCINLCFNKNIFYFIYKKLSKHFRRHDKFKDIKSIQEFQKLFRIWKLLYNFENISSSEQSKNSSIVFNQSKCIVFRIKKKEREVSHLIITINFILSPILNINKLIDNFFFLKVLDKNKKDFIFKYDNVFIGDNNKENYTFSNVYAIQFNLLSKKYDIYINGSQIISKNVNDFDFSLISEFHILNNFYGEVSSININSSHKILNESRKNYDLKIDIYNNNDKINVDINLMENNKIINEEIKEDLVKYFGGIFNNNQSFYYHNFITWKKVIKNINEIEYFGGFDSLIPLFKIIKYKIMDLGKNFKENEDNQKENKDLANNLIIMVIDILKIIVKLIFLSENNYKIFIKTLIPLIGSLAEILHVLNDLSNLELKSLLLKDEIIFILYIIIINSKISKNIIKIYQDIFELENNINNYNFSFDCIIFDIEKIKLNNFEWYFISIFNLIISLLISFDSKEKISINLIKQLNLINDKIYLYESKNSNKDKNNTLLKPFISLIESLCLGKEENIIEKFNYNNDKLGNNPFYLNIIIQMINTIINMNIARHISPLIPFNNNNLEHLKAILIQISPNLSIDIFDKLINNSNFIDDYSHFKEIIPSINENEFIKNSKLLFDNIIDYHGSYHKLMKEQFIFNRLWSNQKLFYNDTIDKKRKSKLKYKNINYYTRNFQRPIIYPQLDYKYRYPSFSKFKIEGEKIFFIDENTEDDYNFDFYSPKLDNSIKEYNEKQFQLISFSENKFKKYNVCRIKQGYHIPGELYIYYKEEKNDKDEIEIKNIIIYFFSSFSCDNENISKCNKENGENNLCYGSIFKCLSKENNRIIKIEVQNIRMIIMRFYYYRRTGLEIFTPTKSYYFNFYNSKDLNSFFLRFECYFNYDLSYEPIKIKDNLLGFININKKNFKSKNIENSAKNFIDILYYRMSKGEICKMSVFDIIIIINLISNRSYIDLNQYPVFPVLYFYESEKQNKIERDLKEHIGFQTCTKESKKRKEIIIQLFNSNKEDLENGDIEEEELNDNINFFNTQYSNAVYTSNYMIRLFPYSFISIEMQGDGFDNPNRLFFSIQDTFNNISKQKSDLRELIPEFFYLPEMLMNINCLNFGKGVDGKYINDVIIPDEEDENTINNSKISNQDINNFIFVASMKNKLENISNDLDIWVRLIFGKNQKFVSKKKDGKLNPIYFRKESYIDIDEEKNQNYLNDNLAMSSFEFGIVPLETIPNEKLLDILHIKKYNEKLKFISNIELKHKNKKKIMNEKNIENTENCYLNNLIKKKPKHDFLDLNYNLELKIDKTDNHGKLEIFWNNNKINEIIDHNAEILHHFYNPRLNMYATTGKDGLVCVYIIPYKLVSVIKHPNNLYFDNVFLSANPFPAIITYEDKNKIFRSYSLSGILIMEKKLEIEGKIFINYAFDFYGGCYSDGILIYDESHNYIKSFYCPFISDMNKNN